MRRWIFPNSASGVGASQAGREGGASATRVTWGDGRLGKPLVNGMVHTRSRVHHPVTARTGPRDHARRRRFRPPNRPVLGGSGPA